MKNRVQQVQNVSSSFAVFSRHLFLCMLISICNPAIAEVELSPKGRIDIRNNQNASEDSNKNLYFKNSRPLKDVSVEEIYISGQQICEVEISTSYFQAANQAKVEATIDHSQCGASNGKYTVSLRVQDQAGEIHSIKYNEVWSRPDSDAITVNHTYPMLDNLELLKARIKLPSRDYCTCIED